MALLAQMRADHEAVELRRQEEMHDYIERIDALQAKLQYLAKEALTTARTAAGSAASGSVDKKMAEKDEQIALLMEEGQKLSKSELKYLSTIRKLRATAKDEEKTSLELHKASDRAERDAADLRQRVKRCEQAEKRAVEKLKNLTQVEKELDRAKSERDSSNALVATLKSQLAQASANASEAENKAQARALEAERRLVSDLRDDLSNAKIEKELGEERVRAELRAVKEKAERDREQARVVEIELRGEQAVGAVRLYRRHALTSDPDAREQDGSPSREGRGSLDGCSGRRTGQVAPAD